MEQGWTGTSNWFETQPVVTWHIDWWGIFLPMWHPLETPKIVPFI